MAPERVKRIFGATVERKTDEDNNKKKIYTDRETEGEGEKERESKEPTHQSWNIRDNYYMEYKRELLISV